MAARAVARALLLKPRTGATTGAQAEAWATARAGAGGPGRRPTRGAATGAQAEAGAAPAPGSVQALRWKTGAVIRMLHDGDCPLCEREVNMLKARDAANGRIDFVDIASPEYDPNSNMGLDYETTMKTIHAIFPDGTVITGVPVFRHLYEQVGLGWVYAVTKNPTVGRLAQNIYDFWAERRTQVTGRAALGVLLERRRLSEEGRVACRSE